MTPDHHQARVYLSQVRVFAARGHMGFAHTLLAWAAKARRRAMSEPKQGQLL